MTSDADWMRLALDEARRAGEAGEVPVGAVVVKDGALLAVGRNAPVECHDPSAHAEINAMRAAGLATGNYRLDGCELFVTLEPCAMCAGAVLHARLARIVYGAADPKTGAAGSVLDLFAQPRLNHRTEVRGGVLAAECQVLLQDFFRERRDAARETAQPLRDDALRTPSDRFEGLAGDDFTAHHVADLRSQQGWRMHYIDEGDVAAGRAVLCLHGPGEWGYFFRHVVEAAAARRGLRLLVPDLIGFGRSDKPKKEAAHRLAWHCDVLLEWLDRLDTGPLVLVHSAAALPLAALLRDRAPQRLVALLAAPEGSEAVDDAWRAPFPDRGHEAALRALGPVAHGVSGPDPGQASRLLDEAMGYFAP